MAFLLFSKCQLLYCVDNVEWWHTLFYILKIKCPVGCFLKTNCPLFQVRGLDQSAGLYQRQSGKPGKTYLSFDWLTGTLSGHVPTL